MAHSTERWSSSLPVLLLALACSGGSERPAAPAAADAAIAFTHVPQTVACIEITAQGAWSVTRRFDVAGATAVDLTVNGLSTGRVRFSGRAFAGGCASSDAVVPTWTGGPVEATLSPGVVTRVALRMRPAQGVATVGVDFESPFTCDAELPGAWWLVGVKTGTTVDVEGVAADTDAFPGAELDGDWVTFRPPLDVFDFLPTPYTQSGIDRIPSELRITTVLGRDGEVCAGVFGGTEAQALSLFGDAYDPFGVEHSSWGFQNNNFENFDFATVRLDAVDQPRDYRIGIDPRNTALGSEVAYRYAVAFNHGYAAGGPVNFTELYDERTWGLESGFAEPVIIAQSSIQFACIDPGGKYAEVLAHAWNPSPGQRCRVTTSRDFDLAYSPAARAVWLEALAVNDNSAYSRVLLDGVVEVAEGPVGSWRGLHHLFNTYPSHVRLEVDMPWSGSYATVRLAVLGESAALPGEGAVDLLEPREEADGVVNPPDSPDQNPPPQTMTFQPGWNPSPVATF